MSSRSGLNFGGVVAFATAAWVAGCSSSNPQVPQAVSQQPASLGTSSVSVAPSSLTLEAWGKPTTIRVTQENYRGRLHSVAAPRRRCSGIADWRPHYGRGPTLAVKVFPTFAGSCAFGFTNAAGRSIAWIQVTVVPTPSPSPSPTPKNVRYYSVPASSGGGNKPVGITVGPDKNLWFTIASGAIGRVTTKGAFTLFTKGIPAASGLGGVARGSDGNIWFAATFGIGRITMNGTVTKYRSSYGGFSAAGITAGPQSLMTVSGSDATNNGGLYSLTTSGAISFIGRVSCSTGGYPAPFSVAPGLNNSVWFGGGAGSCVQEFGAAYSGKWEVAFGTDVVTCVTRGPDGNEWFGISADAGIGVITPTGSETRYSAGIDDAGGGWIGAIASGPDGNLWYTAGNTDTGETYLGRMTTSGDLALFDLGAHGMPGGLAFGPDGAIWFTTPTAIGRATLPPT